MWLGSERRQLSNRVRIPDVTLVVNSADSRVALIGLSAIDNPPIRKQSFRACAVATKSRADARRSLRDDASLLSTGIRPMTAGSRAICDRFVVTGANSRASVWFQARADATKLARGGIGCVSIPKRAPM